MKHILALTISILIIIQSKAQYDICIYGGTSAGVIAAYTAAKQNKKVILIEPGKHLGGLTSGGLGYTDIGNKYVVTGLARDFYRRVGKHYGKFESWIFEPHVAEEIFNQYIKEANVPVLFQYVITNATKQNGAIQSIEIQNLNPTASTFKKNITAKMFIDCSYEGDLMAKAGVSYTVGREDNKTYNETWNGSQLLDKHQFPDGIDPYKIPGDSTSGLLWGISNNKPLPNGTGNKMVQTYNYRICLTNDAANKIDITAPDGYDASQYQLLLRYINKYKPKELNDRVLKIDIMPNHKTDINNNGPFSTDYIGMNWDYPEADYNTRQKFLFSQLQYTKGLLYFIGHDPRMPEHLRNEMLQWGYPRDEYTDNNNFTPQAYIRESRRMIGAYVMTQNNCEGREQITDAAGMAAYTMDSHNCERLVVNGMVKNEGDVQVGGFGPYPVAYRALVPKANECTNLYVPVCLSASHIAYGSIRMEPVFMVLAESSAAAACMAIDNHQTVQQVNVKQLQQLLVQNPLMNGSTPEILVDDNDSLHVTITGAHQKQTTGGYGPTWLQLPVSAQPATVAYTPGILTPGNYTIYVYVPMVAHAATTLHYTINNGTAKNVDIPTPTQAEGQTSGEWITLGTYKLPKGNTTTVTLTSKDVDGVVVADAVLFVPEK
ncbi:FAD-dependent oxidoreductase [Panacibacter ginsenosidivorans]|uniref:FAD-dependent oxidoreductase n=1 Tax=Panacibacter ginsenosidivorans TaxID=1813871 RepID=A0A5B8V7S5_9BACT|nr:FAD-dependent oxidoreductase [Panacibacter ginsenosidivorans]QEC66756.1 FAD-dependent oxidoreductase [Panacibacter ginsenosidivorans]